MARGVVYHQAQVRVLERWHHCCVIDGILDLLAVSCPVRNVVLGGFHTHEAAEGDGREVVLEERLVIGAGPDTALVLVGELSDGTWVCWNTHVVSRLAEHDLLTEAKLDIWMWSYQCGHNGSGYT